MPGGSDDSAVTALVISYKDGGLDDVGRMTGPKSS
jgi:hypothetical protein